MDWDRRPEIQTWVLDEIFDTARGWYISESEASIVRLVAEDGNPFYRVVIGRIHILAYERHTWAPGSERAVSAGRLCAHVEYSGIAINNPNALLSESFAWRGLPSFGLNASGQPTLQVAFPIAPGYPSDLARRQLMVSMGLLALEAENYLTAWGKNPTQSRADRSADWTLIGNVSSVAGKFLRGFSGF